VSWQIYTYPTGAPFVTTPGEFSGLAHCLGPFVEDGAATFEGDSARGLQQIGQGLPIVTPVEDATPAETTGTTTS
jgi:hypothetical protein